MCETQLKCAQVLMHTHEERKNVSSHWSEPATRTEEKKGKQTQSRQNAEDNTNEGRKQ